LGHEPRRRLRAGERAQVAREAEGLLVFMAPEGPQRLHLHEAP
jgi:hypothetical protein